VRFVSFILSGGKMLPETRRAGRPGQWVEDWACFAAEVGHGLGDCA
jgi:hypothetical protein